MKIFFQSLCTLIVISVFISSCGKRQSENELSKTAIIGERINGFTPVRDTINGKIVFALFDSTLVDCTPLRNGHYQIGLMVEISNEEYEKNNTTFEKGREIFINGKQVGVVVEPVEISTSSTGEKSWAALVGYVDEKYIYAETIIENFFIKYVEDLSDDRTMEELQNFIATFCLDKDNRFSPFITYANYENWIDDPSPMYRLQLIFKNDHLIGFVHSRPISISNTTDHKLARGFQVAFYDDVDKTLVDQFVKKFNDFVSVAD